MYYTLQHYIIYNAEVCIYITITTRIEIITKILFIQIQIIQNTQVVPLLVWDTLSLGKEKVRKLLFIIGMFCLFQPKRLHTKIPGCVQDTRILMTLERHLFVLAKRRLGSYMCLSGWLSF